MQRTGHPVAVREQLTPIPLGIGEKGVFGLETDRIFREDAHVPEGTHGHRQDARNGEGRAFRTGR